MRRPDLAAVVNLLITVRVALRTRSQRARGRTEIYTLMLGMTINTADARYFMWLDHRCRERLCTMTRRTALLHVA